MSYSICKELKFFLEKAINCNTILLSGGLDSSILAVLGIDKIRYAITIVYKDAPDLDYAKRIADKCKFEHIIKDVSNEVLNYAKNIIKIMHVFDPIEIRNSIVLYASMVEAKKHDIDCIITGDGSDELFAGYNYMLRFDHNRLEEEIDRLFSIMHFSSINIGEELDINVSMPFLTNEVVRVAKSIPSNLKVREYNNIRYGKWILRECFNELLGEEITFRKKMAMEEGSGLSKLSLLFDDIIDDDEYAKGIRNAKEDGVKIRSKEHLYYYNIFKEEYGIPKILFKRCNFRCPECLSCINIKAKYCRVCGAFPVTPMHTF
jgi:asparagine synthase (glutamine-hydrolysing)